MERDGFHLALFLLLVVALSQVHRFLGLAAFRPAFVLAIGTVGFAVLNPRSLNRGAMRRTWPPKVMLALGVMACISVPFGMSIGSSGSFILERYSNTLIIGLLVVLAIRHARDLYTLVWAFVLSCAWLAFLAIFLVGIGSEIRGGLPYTSYDPNDVGLVLLMGLPLALALFQSAGSKVVRLVSLFTILGAGATLAISSSRGGFVGALAVGLALLVLLKGVSVVKRVAFVAVAAGALVFAAPEGYWAEMESITNPNDLNLTSPYGRKAVWKRGIGYMLANPVTGIGIGNYGRAEGLMGTIRRREGVEGRVKWSAAHNSFLQPGAEMGFPGFILFASLVFGGMISMLRLRKRLPPGWKRGDPQERFLHYMAVYLPVSFVAFVATGFFLSFAYIEPIYILAGFVAGMHASVGVKLRHNQAGGRRRAAPASAPPGRPPPGWRLWEPGRVGTAARIPGAVPRTRTEAGGPPFAPPR